MKLQYSDEFKANYKALPEKIQKKVEKQLGFLLKDFRYPSIHTKKIQGQENRWEIRIDRKYRLVFDIDKEEKAYRLIRVGKHDIL